MGALSSISLTIERAPPLRNSPSYKSYSIVEMLFMLIVFFLYFDVVYPCLFIVLYVVEF